MFAGVPNYIPTNYMECKGQSLSVAANNALFAIIGYTYGGSGNNFNLPNLTNKVVIGN
jgi:microcystin-dependent protein